MHSGGLDLESWTSDHGCKVAAEEPLLKSHDQSQTRTCTPIARVIWRETLVRATVYAGLKLDVWASFSI